MKRFLIVVAMTALVACSTMPNEQSKMVKIIDSLEAQGCTYISTLSAFDTLSPTFEKERESVLVKLKTEAAMIKGNAILLTEMQTNLAGSNGMAKVYSCPPSPDTVSQEKREFTAAEVLLLRASAREGDAESQFLYGSYLLDTNVAEGIEWVTLSANQNYAVAQGYLGLLFYTGDIVEKNYFKAFDWRLKAARNGEVWAQGAIGFAYILGEGVPENVIQAYIWMSMSSTQGNEEIKPWLKKIKSGMSSEQIIIAQNLATQCWKSNYKDCD
jgi:hypothetical protein